MSFPPEVKELIASLKREMLIVLREDRAPAVLKAGVAMRSARRPRLSDAPNP
jgi:hypothetical protein